MNIRNKSQYKKTFDGNFCAKIEIEKELNFSNEELSVFHSVCAMNASLPLFEVRLVVMMLMMQGVKSGAEALKDYQR